MSKLKELIYKVFALNYKIRCLFKIEKGRVFAVMTHDTSESGNIMALSEYMKKRGNYRFFYFTKKDRKKFLRLIFKAPFIMASSEFILMDNAFLPMAFFKIRKATKVIQLWHGTGSIKKFGQDSNTGRIKELEKRANENIDFLTVNSERQISMYAGAFGIKPENVKATGLPRTDLPLSLIMDKEKECKFREAAVKKLNEFLKTDISGKTIILYAPTFRDEEVFSPKLHMDIKKFMEFLPENVNLFLRLHPFVAEAYKDNLTADGVFNVSVYEQLNELLALSDILITDYSSIVFDFCVFKRPMYFFADDMEEFKRNGRGFYIDYENELPGALFSDEKKLAYEIGAFLSGNENEFYIRKREAFLSEFYDKIDGKASERVYDMCIKE